MFIYTGWIEYVEEKDLLGGRGVYIEEEALGECRGR